MEHLKNTLLYHTVSKLYAKLKKNIEKWRSKKPKQKWRTIYNIGAFLAESVGVTVYTDMQNYWYSYSSEVLGSIYFLTAFYTIGYYFQRREYLRGLQATCAVGIVVVCLIVQIQTLKPAKYKYYNLLNFGGRFVFADHDQRPNMRIVRERMISKLTRNVSILLIMINVAFGMFGLPSAYLIVFKGYRVTFLGTELPFFDKDSDVVYFLNISIQLLIAGFGSIGCVSIELGAEMIINGISAFPYLIRVDLIELESELKFCGVTLDARARLRNIFMKVQDYEKLVQELIDVYYVRLFVGPFLFTYSISFSIFGQLILGYPSGYGIAFANYLFLLICCHMGGEVELAKMRIEANLYNMQWYLLPVDSQKQFRSAMNMIQHGGALTIGPFSELSMGTAADLTKIIYRITMLLYRMFT